MQILTFVPILIFSFIYTGCSSIYSVKNSKLDEGLTYFMPKKDLVVTLDVGKKESERKVSLRTTSAYPDYKERYLLKFGTNFLADIDFKIGISSNGLLKTTKSDVISKVGEVVENIATSAGSIYRRAPIPYTNICKEQGEYVFLYEFNQTNIMNKCGLVISIEPLVPKINNTCINNESCVDKNKKIVGIFYRQAEPYKVTIQDKLKNTEQTQLLFSPSYSKVNFLPITKQLFANNTADFIFEEGIPIQYNEKTTSELVALFSLPAKIIEKYFSAIGSLFSQIGSVATKEKSMIINLEALEKEKINKEVLILKIEACKKAISNDDEEGIKTICGNL